MRKPPLDLSDTVRLKKRLMFRETSLAGTADVCSTAPSSQAQSGSDQPIDHTAEVNFTCSYCGSLYEVVRREAIPESVDAEIAC
jgi:hypothetical protein